MSYMAEQLGAMASDVNVTADSVTFEIPDNLLFRAGSADPSLKFVEVMERVKGATTGLEDSDIAITSVVYRESVKSQEMIVAKNISDQRLDLLIDKTKSGLANGSVLVTGKAVAKDDDRGPRDTRPGGGYVRFEIRQKTVMPDGSKPKSKIRGADAKGSGEDYGSIVDQVSKRMASREKALPVVKEEYWDGRKKKGLFPKLRKAPAVVEPAADPAASAALAAEASKEFPAATKQDE